eukprot:TRINITY_DN1921_c1_g1_i1.p1 TRINITY_DN1921_c1_g1~~TRINITY_DN1921_c1_g1_i1.p1  ORF type:complete len:229 (+),score=68.13 TRINITY_DN1921_c1_g1_i1:61-747(+)
MVGTAVRRRRATRRGSEADAAAAGELEVQSMLAQAAQDDGRTPGDDPEQRWGPAREPLPEPLGYRLRRQVFSWLWPESQRLSREDVMRMEMFMKQDERRRRGCNLEALRRTSELRKRVLPADPPTEARLSEIQLEEFAAANDRRVHQKVLRERVAVERRRRRAAEQQLTPAPAPAPADLLPMWVVIGAPTLVFVVQLAVIYCHKPDLFFPDAAGCFAAAGGGGGPLFS